MKNLETFLETGIYPCNTCSTCYDPRENSATVWASNTDGSYTGYKVGKCPSCESLDSTLQDWSREQITKMHRATGKIFGC